MAKSWMAHIKATQAANLALMFKNVLKKVGQTYKKRKEYGIKGCSTCFDGYLLFFGGYLVVVLRV